MKLTQFGFSKLRWLSRNPAFQAAPVRVSFRVLSWEVLRLLNRSIRTNFDGDHGIILQPNEGISRLTYYFGHSEPETFAFMDAYLKNGMCVIDVGANGGLNAISAARRVGSTGKVIAIEPDPSNFERIRQNIGDARFPQLDLIEAACGADEGGQVIVHANEQDSSRTFVSMAEDGGGVPVVSIDRIVAERALGSGDFLKIDVEGFEGHVIKGALETIRSHKVKVILMELDGNLLKREGTSVEEVVSEIEKAGYKIAGWDFAASSFRSADTLDHNTFFVLPSLLA